MPIMDGCEASTAIRRLARKDAQSVRIVAMTANVMTEGIQRALSAGMNAHVGKPIETKDLMETLAWQLSV